MVEPIRAWLAQASPAPETLAQAGTANVIEAPDEKTMAKAAIMLASRGTLRTTTMQAIAIEDLIATLKT